MANPEHVARLLAGVYEWNRWRWEHREVRPDLSRAVLHGINFSEANIPGPIFSFTHHQGIDLIEADLIEADLSRAGLQDAKLHGADLRQANLREAKLHRADLHGANFHGADFAGSFLHGANLIEANLRRANLEFALLSWSQLHGADLHEAIFSGMFVTGIDLRGVFGLNTVVHRLPSSIGIDTLYASGGDIPEAFLRGCGVPDSMIEYARTLVAAERPIDYYSCFISYSSHDEGLAKRLHADLQAAGVRCWFAPHDMQIGDSIIDRVDQAIRLHEKLLLILSESAVASSWVGLEVKTAIMREQRENRRVLFPIRLDDAVLQSTAGWAAHLYERHIGDFRQWKDHDAYQQAFARLLRDLRAGGEAGAERGGDA